MRFAAILLPAAIESTSGSVLALAVVAGNQLAEAKARSSPSIEKTPGDRISTG